jgi:hypothetical protein
MSSAVIIELALIFTVAVIAFLPTFGGIFLLAFLEQRADRAPRQTPDAKPAPVARRAPSPTKELAYYR